MDRPSPGRLNPGVLDGDAQHAFKYGACGALAIALHDATGWPLVAVTDWHNVHDGKAGGGSSLHYLVRHPCGKLLDVDGLHDESDVVEEYQLEADDGRAAIGTSTREDVVEWYVEAQGEPIPIKLAAQFVRVVLDKC